MPATVTLEQIQPTHPATSIARQYASKGRFSFRVPPGQYYPEVPGFRQKYRGIRCIAAVARIVSHHVKDDGILCRLPLDRTREH
jgi:hypothetical protein